MCDSTLIYASILISNKCSQKGLRVSVDWQANFNGLRQTSYFGMGDLSEKLKTELQFMVLTSSKTKGIVEKGNLEKIA